MEPVPDAFEFLSQFPEVIQLAVIYQDLISVLAQHRLVTGLRKVYDAQTIIGEGDPAGIVEEIAAIVGSTVGDRISHRYHVTFAASLIWRQQPAAYSAHQVVISQKADPV